MMPCHICYSNDASIYVLFYFRAFRERKGQPWCSVTVHGFMDSPVTDNGREHGFFNNGDNLYTYILFPDGAWVYTALGGKDVYT